MPSVLPGARQFDALVYGTVFADRLAALRLLHPGTSVILVPDPPGIEHASVWVHAPGGAVVGHLAPDINRWMVPLMLSGERYSATVVTVALDDVESWKRLEIAVQQR